MLTECLAIFRELKKRPDSGELLVIARETLRTGVFPLGMRTGADGEWEYRWLVFNPAKMSAAERDDYIRLHTPPGVRVRVR